MLILIERSSIFVLHIKKENNMVVFEYNLMTRTIHQNIREDICKDEDIYEYNKRIRASIALYGVQYGDTIMNKTLAEAKEYLRKRTVDID